MFATIQSRKMKVLGLDGCQRTCQPGQSCFHSALFFFSLPLVGALGCLVF